MNKTKAMALSLGAAVASAKVAYALSTFELDDLFRPVGLVRRHREWPKNLAFLGTGIVIGGVGALLLARSSTRDGIAKKARKPGDAASNRVKSGSEDQSAGMNGSLPGLEVNPTPAG
jgi:hypothetical protein